MLFITDVMCRVFKMGIEVKISELTGIKICLGAASLGPRTWGGGSDRDRGGDRIDGALSMSMGRTLGRC